MLNRVLFDSVGSERNTPIITAISSLGHSVISNYLRGFASHVDYIYADASKSICDLIKSVSSLKGDSQMDTFCEKFPRVDELSVVIETLILGDSCSLHQGEHLVGMICERWIIRHLSKSPDICEYMPWDDVLSEIEAYFKSSPLSFWLKEHFQSKPYKITHRVCNPEGVKTQLGMLFRTTVSELVDCRTTSGLDDVEYCHTRSDSPLKTDFFDCHKRHSHRTHDFSPICLERNGLIQLSVLSPERMPQAIPACVCPLDDCEGLIPQQRCGKVVAYSDDLKQQLWSSPIQSRSLSPYCHGIVMNSNSSQEIALESFPVITEANSPLMNGDPNLDLPNMCQFDATPESATSTLTKKPRSIKLTEEGNLTQIGSPPRKQQRMIESPSVSQKLAASTAPDNTTDRTGTLDKVIADFTQLNVELTNFVEHSGNFIIPSDGITADSVSPTSIVCPPSCSHTRDEVSIIKDTRASPDPPSKGGNPVALSRSLSSTSGGSHWPRERRRNATSACIPNCSPSDSFVAFNRRTGLPLQSSPVPLKRSTSGRFDFDSSLSHLKPARSSACMMQTFYPPTDIPTRPKTGITPSTINVQATTSNPTSQPRRRRRPASLRLNFSEQNPAFNPLFPSSQAASCRSRPSYVSELDHQSELSCSAPPSGDRNLLHAGLSHDRMVNTLACTPVSYGSSQHLLVNFEESMLNGRIHPVGQVEGFTLELGASGSFFPSHERLPLTTYFFDLSDDNKPSPYLGYADLSHLRNGKGYLLPMKGSVQLTLFNPNQFVVKMFVIGYDFEDMPPNSQTFLRQRTVYMPVQPPPKAGPHKSNFYCGSTTSLNDMPAQIDAGHSGDRLSVPDIFWSSSKPSSSTEMSSSALSCSCSSLSSICSSACSAASHQTVNSMSSRLEQQPAFLRYLVHLRFHTTRSGRLYLHTDLRLIFARDKFEFDPRVATYELRSFVDAPTNPRYSPKKWTKRSRRLGSTNPRVYPGVTTH